MSEPCDHPDFESYVQISRMPDAGRFAADIRIRCSVCGTPFEFLGLPAGLIVGGAAVSIDGLEARLDIAPEGTGRSTLALIAGALAQDSEVM